MSVCVQGRGVNARLGHFWRLEEVNPWETAFEGIIGAGFGGSCFEMAQRICPSGSSTNIEGQNNPTAHHPATARSAPHDKTPHHREAPVGQDLAAESHGKGQVKRSAPRKTAQKLFKDLHHGRRPPQHDQGGNDVISPPQERSRT